MEENFWKKISENLPKISEFSNKFDCGNTNKEEQKDKNSKIFLWVLGSYFAMNGFEMSEQLLTVFKDNFNSLLLPKISQGAALNEKKISTKNNWIPPEKVNKTQQF